MLKKIDRQENVARMDQINQYKRDKVMQKIEIDNYKAE